MDLDAMMDSLDNEIAKEFEIRGPRQVLKTQPRTSTKPIIQPAPVPREPAVIQMVEIYVTPAIRIGDREFCGAEVVNEHVAAQLRHMMLLSNRHKESVTIGGEAPIVNIGHVN